MKRVVYKYPLGDELTLVYCHESSKVLCAGQQGDDIVVWVEHPKDAEYVEGFGFIVVPTGMEFELSSSGANNGTYLNTVQMKDGLVFHIYYVRWSKEMVNRIVEAQKGATH